MPVVSSFSHTQWSASKFI